MAVADPDIFILFESWLDELEQEVIEYIKDNAVEAIDLASELGLSRSGANFLLAKPRKAGKVWQKGRYGHGESKKYIHHDFQ